jgi:hypothetical protein
VKLNLKSHVKTAKNVLTANSPVLLVGTAVVGVISTGVLAAIGGYKARGIVDEERMRRVASPEPPFDTYLEYHQAFKERAPELTFQEKAGLTWLCYAVPSVTGLSTLAAVLGVHAIHTKRHAAMAGLYAVTTTKLDDYTERAEEMLGKKKSEELNNDMAQKAVERAPFDENLVTVTGYGKDLFMDELTGRYFYSSMAKVENANNEINRKLIDEGDATLNDFYDDMGLDTLAHLGDYGWHTMGDSPNSVEKVSVQFGSCLTKNGKSAITVWFREVPRPNVGR